MIQRISQMRKRQSEGGFTLIELLVVIIILGILSGVVVFAVRGTGDKGKTAAIKTDKSTLVTAQQAYCAKTGTFGTERQLAGLDPATGSTETFKFLSEPSVTHDVQLGGGQACGNNPASSSFLITGDAAAIGPNGGGPFVVGSSMPGIGLNPAVNTQGGMQNVSALLFNGLVGIEANSTPVPELAESWTIGGGGTTYKFQLRPGVKWSDSGQTTTANTSGGDQLLTAEDVKFSYEAALLIWHARTSSSVRGALTPACTDPVGGTVSRRLVCDGIVANEADPTSTPPGRATVTFNFGAVYGPLLQQLAMTDGAIIPKHVWPTCNQGTAGPCPTTAAPWPGWVAPGGATLAVGTGPFRLKQTETASDILYDKNPNFWKPGTPYFNQVKYTTANNTYTGLANGNVDWLWGVSGADLTAAKGNSALVVDTGTASAGGSTNCTLKLIYNLWTPGNTPAQITGGTATPHPVLGTAAVRRAIAKGLRRAPGDGGGAGYVSIVNANDGAKLAASPFNSGLAVAPSSPAPLPAYDPVAADTELTAAGFPDTNGATAGGRFAMNINGFSGSQTTLMNTIRDDLAPLGITVTVNTVAPTAMTTLYSGRNYDSLLFSNCQLTDPEVGVRRVYHTQAITGAAFTNGAGYTNATVDGLFDQARQSLDPAVRRQKYGLIQQQLSADMPTLYLLENVANRAYRANCSGLRAYTGHFAELGSCLR